MQCCMLSCDTLWNHKTNRYEPNPYGETVASLYLGTEMKLYDEIEPIIWSCISGVPEYKLREQRMTKEEEERVLQAKEIAKRSPIYLENEPDYDCAFITHTVETYVVKHNIGALIFDYIELIPTLTAEYVRLTRGVQAREDMILLHLSTVLKNIANNFNIYVHAYTQIANEARRDESIRDSGAIKGSKSLQARADLGIVSMRPTAKEYKILEPIVAATKGITPNICLNIYKNRGGVYVEVKVWCRVDLGNMKVEPLFVTNWHYELLGKIKPTELKAYVEPEVEFEPEDDFKEFRTKTVEILDDDSMLPFDPETGEIIEDEPKLTKTSKRLSSSRRR